MKHILLFIFTLCVMNPTKAQALEFSYDSAGNQIQRELVTIFVNSLLSTNNMEGTEKEEDTLLHKANALNANSTTIEFYPNPVVDILNVEWDSTLQPTEIMLFDNKGKLLQLKKVYEGTIREIFDLSTYASGIYYIRVFDANKQSKSYKIIKK